MVTTYLENTPATSRFWLDKRTGYFNIAKTGKMVSHGITVIDTNTDYLYAAIDKGVMVIDTNL